MEPEQNLFSWSLLLMTMQGMTTSSNKVYRLIAFVWKYLMLYAALHFPMISLLAIVTGDNPYYLKLETSSCMFGGMSMAYRHFLIVFKRKEVLRLMDRINALVDKVVRVNGEEMITQWEILCYRIMLFSASIVSLSSVPTYAYSYYKFYAEGIVTAPYELYMPFEKDEDHIHHMVIYQILSLLEPAMIMVVSNTFIGTVVVVISGITMKIAERYEGINRNNVYMLKDTIDWHSELVMIVEDTNALLGSAIMVDCLLSMAHISTSGYLLVMFGFQYGRNLHKYIFLNLLFLAIPSYFCFCGHIISLGSDKLHEAVYHNYWYELIPSDRKLLLLPARMANKGLALHFRNVVEFNLPTYLAIIKQSYSFIAVLKLMDA